MPPRVALALVRSYRRHSGRTSVGPVFRHRPRPIHKSNSLAARCVRSAPRWSAAGKGWSCSRLGRVVGVTISSSRRQATSSSGAVRTISCSPRHEAEHRPRPLAAALVPQVGVSSTVQAVAQMRPSVVRQTESSVGTGSSWEACMCRYARSQCLCGRVLWSARCAACARCARRADKFVIFIYMREGYPTATRPQVTRTSAARPSRLGPAHTRVSGALTR